MKDKVVKYKEAVERNLKSFLAAFNLDEGDMKRRLAKDTVESLRTRIGIKATDTGHDIQLNAALEKAQNFVKKEHETTVKEKKEKKEEVKKEAAKPDSKQNKSKSARGKN